MFITYYYHRWRNSYFSHSFYWFRYRVTFLIQFEHVLPNKIIKCDFRFTLTQSPTTLAITQPRGQQLQKISTVREFGRCYFFCPHGTQLWLISCLCAVTHYALSSVQIEIRKEHQQKQILFVLSVDLFFFFSLFCCCGQQVSSLISLFISRR